MKQYLAVEKLKDENGKTGWYQLKYSAWDEASALDWVEDYKNFFGTKVKYCGEITN